MQYGRRWLQGLRRGHSVLEVGVVSRKMTYCWCGFEIVEMKVA